MDRLRRLLLPLLAISFLVPAQGAEVGEGVIQGVVLGEVARPVRGAKVHAELKGVPMGEKMRYVETDENGFFLIDQLEFGTYYVAAENEEEGYGDSGFSFFNDQPVPTLEIHMEVYGVIQPIELKYVNRVLKFPETDFWLLHWPVGSMKLGSFR